MLEKMDKIVAPTEDSQEINLILPQTSRPPSNMVSCRGVSKHYGVIEVFNNMNMMVDRGQKIGLVGNNGAGKSTLLKMLAGVEPVSSGEVRVGSNVNRAYYAQHQLETLDPDDTVFESIQKVSSGWNETKIRTYLGSFLFTGDGIEKMIKIISGGEKARLALARMLVKPSHLLLLDEPTNHLDMVSRNVVETALVQFTGSIVCISHDRHFLNNVTNLTCEVGGGTIQIFDGNYKYYIWKKGEKMNALSLKPRVKTKSKKKSDYLKKKKIRNRLIWIEKRFKTIEKELDEQRIIFQNSANADDYELLQKTMETINVLEKEYLELMEEQEVLKD